MRRTGQRDGVGARERILTAAGELFAESGFDATPTSRIAERAEVPKGLVHYYFRRKQDLLAALIERLPDVRVDLTSVVVPGDVATSLRQLVAALDRGLDASPLLSHLLWRETDTHPAVRDALDARLRGIVSQIREVLIAAREATGGPAAETALVGEGRVGAREGSDDIESAAALLALAVSYRHSVARHTQPADVLDRELDFVARALESG
ncbi:TetR/AcrR family transcriptional regulator [Actinoalloteichus sp. AHMU CJ021]|uniref:TetR/AcrR family transcriptional regulator n=1 Tax=Actinoalloteichus TaxID=65496 RepID=UPI000479E13E|nr:TetR/AcrR family transcriptional regulator [Actinoalloteichus caeruleus]AUS79877.1 TetR/AcrR family transcriptional regulator [Actinoalloteichus sp. AHMU CJ021]